MSDLVCRNVLLCDEIRQEKSEKYILIGVYTHGLIVPVMPAKIRLSLYLAVEFSEIGAQDIVIDVRHNDSHARIEVQVGVNLDGVPTAIPTPPFPMTFEEPGELIVSIGRDQETLFEVARFPTLVNQDVWSLFPSDERQPLAQSENDAPETDSPPEPSPQRGGKRKARL